MAKWIVEATPIPNHPGTVDAVHESKTFMRDNEAKEYVREKELKHLLITVRNTPEDRLKGVEIEMNHAQALYWAYSK